MLSAIVGDSASFSATAWGETMTRAEAGELINGALTGNPGAIKNLIAGGIFGENDVARSEHRERRGGRGIQSRFRCAICER